jgi:hypothetical protein
MLIDTRVPTEAFSIAYSATEAKYSYDGLYWVTSSLNSIADMYSLENWSTTSVSWNGSYWLATGVVDASNNYAAAISSDGINWILGGSLLQTKAVAWNGSYWIAVGSTSNVVNIGTSPDGITWTYTTANIPFNDSTPTIATATAVAWNGSYWLVTGQNNVFGSKINIIKSYDGINWVASGAPFTGDGGVANGIAWNGSLWVAVGAAEFNSVTIATSIDGSTWTTRTNPFDSFRAGNAIAWNGVNWVAIGGKIVTSQDGITWTESSNNPFVDGYASGIAWNGCLWILTCVNGIATSPDGSFWTLQPGPSIGVVTRRVLPYVVTSSNTANATTTLGKVLTVDSVNGNNSTASRGGKPYLTIQAANTAAVSGDTIWVLPGTYNLTAGITLTAGTSLTGISTQTVIIQMLSVTANTSLITMGENTRLENVTMKLTSAQHHTLVGLTFPGTTSVTAKLRTCVLTVDNSGAAYNGVSNITGVLFSGTGTLAAGSFSFNSLKGSTINVYSNGGGDKRGILVNNTNVTSTRDVNIYVAQPTSPGATGATGATGSYVGVETADAENTGSIQLRATTVGTVRPVAGNSYTASDILQTNPTTITNPTYLASAGIQVGPGTDLVTKTAGGKGFSTYNYPTTIYYGALGTMTNARKQGYMWPGTIIFSNTYPDQTTPVARYRVQQPAILVGISATCNLVPVGDSVVITVCKNAAPATGNLISNATPFTVTLNNTSLNANFYDASVTFNTGDFINLYITANDNTIHDLAVQLDMF